MLYKSTSLWGPYLWHLMHHIAHYNKDENRNEQIEFYNRILHVIPCQKCREHYSKYISENPANIDLSRWLYNAHENVNSIQNREGISFEECNKIYHNDNFNDYYAQKCLDIIVHNLNNSLYDIENFKKIIRLLFKIYPNDILRMKLITISEMYKLNDIYDYKTLYKWYLDVSNDWIPKNNNLVLGCKISDGKKTYLKSYKLNDNIVKSGKTVYNTFKDKRIIYQNLYDNNGKLKRICLLKNCNKNTVIKEKNVMTNVDFEFIKKVSKFKDK